MKNQKMTIFDDKAIDIPAREAREAESRANEERANNNDIAKKKSVEREMLPNLLHPNPFQSAPKRWGS